jgi:flagellar basal body-associated protein FliL
MNIKNTTKKIGIILIVLMIISIMYGLTHGISHDTISNNSYFNQGYINNYPPANVTIVYNTTPTITANVKITADYYKHE